MTYRKVKVLQRIPNNVVSIIWLTRKCVSTLLPFLYAMLCLSVPGWLTVAGPWLLGLCVGPRLFMFFVCFVFSLRPSWLAPWPSGFWSNVRRGFSQVTQPKIETTRVSEVAQSVKCLPCKPWLESRSRERIVHVVTHACNPGQGGSLGVLQASEKTVFSKGHSAPEEWQLKSVLCPPHAFANKQADICTSSILMALLHFCCNACCCEGNLASSHLEALSVIHRSAYCSC